MFFRRAKYRSGFNEEMARHFIIDILMKIRIFLCNLPIRLSVAVALTFATLNAAHVKAQFLIKDGVTRHGHTYWFGPLLREERSAISFAFHPASSQADLDLPMIQFLGLDVTMLGDNALLSADDIAEALADLDAEINFTGTYDQATVTLQAPARNLVAAARLLNPVLTAPKFEPRSIQRMKRYLRQDDTSARTSSQGALDDLAADMLMDRHPLRPLIRHFDDNSLSLITRQDLIKWHKRAFTKDHLSIGVASTASDEIVERAIDAALDGLQPLGPDETPITVPTDLAYMEGLPQKIILLHKPDAGKTLLATHFPLTPKSAQNTVYINLVTLILGTGQQSRLFQALRQELRAAYDFTAMLDEYSNDIQFLRLVGEIDDSRVPEALSGIETVVKTLVSDGIAAHELDVAKNLSARYFEGVLSLESHYANYLALQQALKTPKTIANSFLAALATVNQHTFERTLKDGPVDWTRSLTLVVSPNADMLAGLVENLDHPVCIITAYRDWRNC